jgi:succinate-semialdehyde dehydrogenase/glutarate-semialdehyde dehydrogenase
VVALVAGFEVHRRVDTGRGISRAIRVAEALDFGLIGINDINPTSAAVPFGGIKESGLGREGARTGIAEYLDTKVLGIAL